MKCPLCHADQNIQIEGSNEICKTCCDIIEFGYPSFPAYLLEKQTIITSENQERTHDSNGRQLTTVG